jgi:probable HAF family extracellular repeat protein
MVDLGSLGGNSEAKAVNENGQAVGYSYGGPFLFHAFSWTQATGMSDLGAMGGADSQASAVNDNGQVVGTLNTSTSSPHGFSWTQGGGMVDVGTLGGARSFAHAVNNNGQVVGLSSTTTTFVERGFSWTETGGMVDLGSLGGDRSEAYGVNDNGQVVGSSWTTSSAYHAFSWTEGGGMVDLLTLGGSSGVAYAVNGTGQAVGTTSTSSGEEHAALWNTATPATPPGTPAPPVATAGNGSAEVSWSAPNDGGSPITGYTVTASPGGKTASVNGSTLTAVVSGLSNCTTYTFTVRATNAIGTGEASAASNAVTPSTTTAVSVGESGNQVLYSPQRIDVPGEQCVRVKWTFKSTNTKSHTVTESSSSTLGLGAAGAPLFNSGPVAAGGSFTYLFKGATAYQYRSTASGDSNSPSLYGLVRMPVIVSPTSGSKTGSNATTFLIRVAQEAMPGYAFTIEYQFKTGAKGWPTDWTVLSSNNIGTVIPFPKTKLKTGMYRFRSVISNVATGRRGGYSWTDVSGLVCPCQFTVT